MLSETIEFCEKHKSQVQIYPKLSIMASADLAHGSLRHTNLGHLPITGLEIPVKQILDEIKNCDFIEHHEVRSYKRFAFILFGKAVQTIPLNPVHSENYDKLYLQYQTLDNRWLGKDSAPFTTNYFQNHFPVTNYSHIVVMKLLPGGWIAPHIDTYDSQPGYNFNIPLTLPSGSIACNTQGEVPYKIGDAMMFNTSIFHAIYNNSQEDRYMISISVGDIEGMKPELKKLISTNYLEQAKSSLQASR